MSRRGNAMSAVCHTAIWWWFKSKTVDRGSVWLWSDSWRVSRPSHYCTVSAFPLLQHFHQKYRQHMLVKISYFQRWDHLTLTSIVELSKYENAHKSQSCNFKSIEDLTSIWMRHSMLVNLSLIGWISDEWQRWANLKNNWIRANKTDKNANITRPRNNCV